MNALTTTSLVAPVAKGLQIFKPNRSQEKFIENARGFLQLVRPFYAALLHSSCPIRYTYDVPRLATDGSYCYVNPDSMEEQKWTIPNVGLGLAHEVVHVLRNDIIMGIFWRTQGYVPCKGGDLPYDHDLMGAAADYVINAMLLADNFAEFPPEGLYDPALSRAGMERSIDIYEILFKRREAEQKKQQQGQPQPGQGQPQPGQGQPQQSQDGSSGQGTGNFDQHLEPSQEAIEAEAKGGATQRAQAIASARMVAEAAGKGDMPAALRQLIGEIMSPKVKWQDHLKSSMHRAAGTPGLNWTQLNKRLISRPDPWGPISFARKTEYGCGTIVVGYDTSGSCIDEATQTKFFTEMSGIVADLNPEKLVVIWCDQEVQRVDEIEGAEDLEMLRHEINEAGGAPGGGGTNFVPVFDYVHDTHLEPDMLIFLTDTLGIFPAEPDYPVIWCSLLRDMRVPFGELVEIDD